MRPIHNDDSMRPARPPKTKGEESKQLEQPPGARYELEVPNSAMILTPITWLTVPS